MLTLYRVVVLLFATALVVPAAAAFADDNIYRKDDDDDEVALIAADDDDDDTGDGTGTNGATEATGTGDDATGDGDTDPTGDGTFTNDGTAGGDNTGDDSLNDDTVSDCDDDSADDLTDYCDVKVTDAHAASIRKVTAAGIAHGFGNGSFQPGNDVSRAQMATFLARAFGLEATGDDGRFGDTEGNAHADAIAALVQSGIATGYPDGTYRPSEDVTRGQMAAFLTRALDLPEGVGSGFADTNGHAHEPAIAAIADAAIAQGYADGTFGPGHDVTRAQMATFLAQALSL